MKTRWSGITRTYSPEDVERLRGSVPVQHTLADRGARRFWRLLQDEPWVPVWRAADGRQAVEAVRAGAQAIDVSGGTAADHAGGVPGLVRRVSQALQRVDEAEHASGRVERDWLVPLVAEAGAGSADPLKAFELTQATIEAGAAAVCFDDRLASEEPGGDAGDRVVVSTGAFVRALTAARLAADVMGVPTVLVARTSARGATRLASDADPRDREFILPDERTAEGGFRLNGGIEFAIARACACAPYADVLWYEAVKPDLGEARAFAEGVHGRHPGKLLACDASAWLEGPERLEEKTWSRVGRELCSAGYRLQLVALAGRPPASDTATSASTEISTVYRDQILRVVAGDTDSTPVLQGPKAAGRS